MFLLETVVSGFWALDVARLCICHAPLSTDCRQSHNIAPTYWLARCSV